METLSLVIPVYNEQNKIKEDILAAHSFFKSVQIKAEIVIVDDGSSDNTSSIAKDISSRIDTPCIIEQLDKNYGKGRAVRTGILKSRGQFVLFADSGLCIPFEEVKVGIDLIRSGQCQIAHASRKISGCHITRPQSVYRRICSKLFHWFLIHDIHGLGNLTDTQCGFKVYNGKTARGLYSNSTVDGFMFDIEIILLALSEGLTICEFPVVWTCDLDSRLKPAQESINVFLDLIQLKRRFKDSLKNS